MLLKQVCIQKEVDDTGFSVMILRLFLSICLTPMATETQAAALLNITQISVLQFLLCGLWGINEKFNEI